MEGLTMYPCPGQALPQGCSRGLCDSASCHVQQLHSLFGVTRMGLTEMDAAAKCLLHRPECCVETVV